MKDKYRDFILLTILLIVATMAIEQCGELLVILVMLMVLCLIGK